MTVVSYEKQGKVTLQNLVTGNTDEYHISRLRPFYSENENTLKQTANRDNQEWDVDFIVDLINLREKCYSFACDGLDMGKMMTHGNHVLI